MIHIHLHDVIRSSSEHIVASATEGVNGNRYNPIIQHVVRAAVGIEQAAWGSQEGHAEPRSQR